MCHYKKENKNKSIMCHYKKGNEDKITFVFSCPGRIEEKAKEPASGRTGKNLDLLLEELNKELKEIGCFKRENISITNATHKVEFKARTHRTEATVKEVLDKKNLNRLYKEIKNTTKLIVCSGRNANLAVDKIFEIYDDINAKKISIGHIGMQSINSTIKKDINGKELKKGNKGNTEKRLQVIALDIKSKFEAISQT